ncbi:MAG: uracil-DNA glycosylase [Gemmobacter sp.]|uniref:uracil-DNA glycosylase n=1 Tax=Gemmobacter sp. TaxID=1898957 RepID=UPI001A4FFC4D|nr:uracil-DNA glycosylase [Gemmobacter sp.]MBL8562491.1 uracil-DNA glycosylase [Gemmobacter sp.]
MGIAQDILEDWHASFAALSWWQELGVLDPIGEATVDRYALPAADPHAPQRATPAAQTPRPQARPAAPAPEPEAPKVDPVAVSRQMAAACATREALHEALAAYPHCDLKKGARNTVLSDGNPQARVMIIGEAPGADEDRQGLPFVGRAGQMLDRMFAAIGLARSAPDASASVYITNVMPWKPPGNRDPSTEEIAMMLPFLERHVALIDPDVMVVMGNIPAQAVLRQRGITRLRGQWAQAWGKPVLPMLHPAYLLRNPIAKREAWADLLALQAHLRTPPQP